MGMDTLESGGELSPHSTSSLSIPSTATSSGTRKASCRHMSVKSRAGTSLEASTATGLGNRFSHRNTWSSMHRQLAAVGNCGTYSTWHEETSNPASASR